MDLDFNADFKKSLLLELDMIIEPKEETERERNQVKKRVLESFPSNVWNVNTNGNMEVQMEVDFKKFLFAITEQTSINVEEKSVFDFYALLDSLKERKKNAGSNN